MSQSACKPQVVTFGDLVAAAFDRAGLVTDDPRASADLATRTVGRWLARTGRSDLGEQARRLAPQRGTKRPVRRNFSHAA
jgi:hypothetical protein